MSKDSYIINNVEISPSGDVLFVEVNGKRYFSGQDWYDRYQAEIERLTDLEDIGKAIKQMRADMPAASAGHIMAAIMSTKLNEAAKRAAGISDEV